MALTKISTAGVKDDAVTNAKLAHDSVGSDQIANNSVTTSELADDAVDTNAIQNNAVTAAKLASGVTDLSNDTSPQLGGTLDTNGNDIKVGDSDVIRIGNATYGDLKIFHDGTDSTIDNVQGDLNIKTTSSGDDINITALDDVVIRTGGTKQAIVAIGDAETKLYHNAQKKFETMADGVILQDLENNTVQVKLNTAQGTGGSLYANTAASALGLLTTSGDWALKSTNDGSTELYNDNDKKLETHSNGTKTTGYHQQSSPIGFTAWRSDSTSGNAYPLKNSSGAAINNTYFGHTDIQNPRGNLTTNTTYNSNGAGGTCFSNTGTIFTAPVAGVYVFHFNLSLYVVDGNAGSDNSVGWGFYKNQSPFNFSNYTSGLAVTQSTPYVIGQDTTTNLTNAFEIGAPSMTSIINLAANDDIQVGWYNMGTALGVRSFIFTGYLL